MTPARELRARLEASGVALTLEGVCNLRLKGAVRPAPDLMVAIREAKSALIALLRSELANDARPAVPPADLDPERAAIMAEEFAPMASPAEHRAAVAALMRVALPPFPGSLLHGIPGAFACAICQRGIWCSPSWPGPPPAICRQCELGARP